MAETACPSENTLGELAEGALARDALPALHTHLAGCANCRAVVARIASLSQRTPEQDGESSMDAGAVLEPVDPRRYQLRHELARGGMGAIYEAWDARHGRRVAIKMLLHRDAGSTRRFVREARISARLSHPSIVTVYEAGRWDEGEPFLALELIEGKPLSAVIAACGSMAERLALLPHLLSTADALAYAHAQGVIHRDLKPANVLVGQFGETVIIDWGLAKEVGSADEPSLALPVDDATLSIAGRAMGTPSYMPPEQARGEPVDVRADVYALGALLYHALSGEPPYRGQTAAELIDQVKAGAPVPLEERAPEVPRDLATIVRKAMSRDPALRYPSARLLADDLRRFQTGQLVSARSYTPLDRARRWLARNKRATAVLLLLTALGAAFVNRLIRERDRTAQALQIAQSRADELTLLQSRALLATDPTASAAWLATYPLAGADWSQARGLLATAMSDGVALDVLRNPRFMIVTPFSPDGKLVAQMAPDRTTVLVRAVDTGAVVHRLPLGRRLLAVQFRADSSGVIAATYDGSLVDLPWTGAPPRDLVSNFGLAQMALSSNGRDAVAMAEGSGRLISIDLRTGETRDQTKTLGAFSVAGYSDDGRRLAWVEHDALRLRDIESGVERAFPVSHIISGIAISRDGGLVAATGEDNSLTLYSFDNKPQPQLAPFAVAYEFVSFTHDGLHLAATSTHSATAYYISLADGSRRAIPLAATAGFSLAVSPVDESLAFGTRDGPILIIDPATLASATLRGHTSKVIGLAFSNDGTTLASTSEDTSVRVWRTPRLRTRTFHTLPRQVFLTPDGRTLATLEDGGTAIKVWDLASGAVRILPESSGATWLSLSPDGRLGAGAMSEETRIWDLASGEMVRKWKNPKATKGSKFSPDGKWLANAADDGTIFLWSLDSGELQTFHDKPGLTTIVGFDSKSENFYSYGEVTYSVTAWNLKSGKSVELEPGTPHLDFTMQSGSARMVWHNREGDFFERLADGAVVPRGRVPAQGTIRDGIVEGDPRIAVSAGREVMVLEPGSKTPRMLGRHDGGVYRLGFCGGKILSGGKDQTLRMWDPQSGAMSVLAHFTGVANWLACVPGGESVVVGLSTEVLIIDLRNTEPLPADPSELIARLARLTTAVASADKAVETP